MLNSFGEFCEWNHSFSRYAKFSNKLLFLTPPPPSPLVPASVDLAQVELLVQLSDKKIHGINQSINFIRNAM